MTTADQIYDTLSALPLDRQIYVAVEDPTVRLGMDLQPLPQRINHATGYICKIYRHGYVIGLHLAGWEPYFWEYRVQFIGTEVSMNDRRIATAWSVEVLA